MSVKLYILVCVYGLCEVYVYRMFLFIVYFFGVKYV